MGIVSEVLPAFSRKPLFGYPVVVYSGVLIGFMGWGVWSHHMFSVGLGPIADAVFSSTTMLIAIPTGVKIFNWIATLWGGAIRGATALHFAVGFIAMFIIGGLSGVTHASPPGRPRRVGADLPVPDRRVPPRRGDPRFPLHPLAPGDKGPPRPERPVGRRHPRVGRSVAAAGVQLLGDPEGREPPAALEDRAPRADAGPAARPARAGPCAGRVRVAARGGTGTAGARSPAAHAPPLAGARGRRHHHRRHLPLGLRGRRDPR